MKTIKNPAVTGYEAPDICLVGCHTDNIICTSVSSSLLDDVTVEDYGEL